MAKHNSTTKPKVKAKVIPAVGYCRKSTNEEEAAKSIADQKARIRDLAPPDPNAEYEVKRWYTLDLGVPGWKRGAARPDYYKMVGEIKQHHDVKAVLVDDFDRFSRADPMETVSDVQTLRELGVRFVHAVNQGSRDLVEGGAMTAMQIAMDANASHEFSTRLSRRICLARKDRAEKSRRSGGAAPYGMKNEGSAKKDTYTGHLLPGDPGEVRTVRWIFDQFTNKHRSFNSLAAELNRKGVPAARGGKWYPMTVRGLLQRRAYRGDMTFGEDPQGQFHRIGPDGKVVPVHKYDEETEDGERKPVYVAEGAWEPLVDPKLFDLAQKRLESFGGGSRRPRDNAYALTGVLVCDHCGGRMYAVTRESGSVQYRCMTHGQQGAHACHAYTIPEAKILPAVLDLLGEEMNKILAIPAPTPERLTPTPTDKGRIEQQLAKLDARIEKAAENLMEADDRSRRVMQKKINVLWAERDRLDAELNRDESDASGKAEQIRELADWWTEFKQRAVKVPYPDEGYANTKTFLEAFDAEAIHYIDRAALKEALVALGCEVRLRWKTKSVTLSNGKKQMRHELTHGRFRMGQKSGLLRRSNLEASACRPYSDKGKAT